MLTKILLGLISLLPLRAHHFLGNCIGLLLYYSSNRNKHIAKVNIELCFPGLSHQEKNQLLKNSLKENGKTLIECFWLWRHPKNVLDNLLGTIENKHLLTNMSENNLGTIFVTPHFGSWEYIGLLTASHSNLIILYAPPKSSHVNKLSCEGRESTGGKVVSTEELSIKKMIQHIKAGGSVGILPDQVPDGNGGVHSNFFGRKCYTSTLVCKLANKLHCPVVFCYALRKYQPSLHYNARYIPASDDIYSNNIEVATNALNLAIEQMINQSPEQYIWGYKRFKRPAAGDSYPY